MSEEFHRPPAYLGCVTSLQPWVLQIGRPQLDCMAPCVTLITARIDPLRSDGAKIEKMLKKANVPVERRDYESVLHKFFGSAAPVPKAKEAQAFAGERLKQGFGTLIA